MNIYLSMFIEKGYRLVERKQYHLDYHAICVRCKPKSPPSPTHTPSSCYSNTHTHTRYNYSPSHCFPMHDTTPRPHWHRCKAHMHYLLHIASLPILINFSYQLPLALTLRPPSLVAHAVEYATAAPPLPVITCMVSNGLAAKWHIFASPSPPIADPVPLRSSL